jgi:putative peptidoglycan lipid II flippase
VSRSPTPEGEVVPKNDAPEASAVEQRKIAGRAGIVAAGTLFSRVLGLVRDQVIAAVFSRAITDAFFVAFTLPNVLRQLLGEGAVQSAVLPVLAATREREGDAAARRFFAAVRGLSLALLTIVSALGVVFAPALVELFAGGFREHPGQFERTVTLTRWVFPYIFFVGTAALGVAALNTYQRFTAAAFAPALLNVAFVAFSLTLPALLDARGYDPGLALAVAVLVGGVLQVIAQWPSLRAIGFLGRPSLELGHPGLRAVLARMIPVAIGMGVYYVDVLLARRFLSEEGVGAQSYFSWALRLCDFPQGIFVMALQAAALPSLARFAARGDLEELSRTFAFGMRMVLFVALPATLLSMTIAEPLVALLFERGAFDATSTRETARALVAQGAGIWLVALVRQLLAVYYALGDTKTPVIVAAIDLAAFTVAALGLRGALGHVGVSLAVSVASLVQAALLWVGLRAKLPALHTRAILGSGARTLLASVLAAAAAMGLVELTGSAGASRAMAGACGALGGVVAFVLGAVALKSSEALVLLRRVRRRA